MEPGATTVGGAGPGTGRADGPLTPRERPGRDGIAARLAQVRVLAGRAYTRARGSASARALRMLDEQEATRPVYRKVFQDAPVAIALLDERLRIVEVNAEALRMLDRPAEGLRGRPVAALAAPPHPARLGLMARKAASGVDPVVVEHRYRRPDGSEGWARTAIRRIDAGEPAAALVCVLEDITSDQMALEEQRREAERDPLTGLLNRRGGDRRLRVALEKMAQSGPVAVVVCDADRFKEVNDRFGHAAGDELLAGMAARLRSAVRSGDDVARMGGDEFIVVARVANEQEAAAIAERCVHRASGPFRLSDPQTASEQVTLSAGVAVAYPGGPVEPRSLLAAADRALYAAKAEGGGRWKMATAR